MSLRRDNMWDVLNPTTAALVSPKLSAPSSQRPPSKPASRSEVRSVREAVPAKLPPIGPNRSMPQIQAETDLLLAGARESGEVQMRLRDLEVQLFDLKSSLERRVQRVAEEIPMHLKREFKTAEQRAAAAGKDVEARQEAQQDALLLVKESLKVNLEDLHSKLALLGAENEELKSRINTQERNSSRLESLWSAGMASGATAQGGGSGGSEGAAVETEVLILREAVADLRRQQKEMSAENQSRARELREALAATAGEMQRKLGEQRDAAQQAAHWASEQNERRQEGLAAALRAEMGIMKQEVASVATGALEDRRTRAADTDAMAQWVEEKIKALGTGLTAQERQKLEREKQMLVQFGEGFQAVSELVRDQKEEGVFQMSKTEVILRDQLTQLAQEVLALRKAVGVRLDTLEAGGAEQRGAMAEMQATVARQSETLNQHLEKELLRFEKMAGALEQRCNGLDTEFHSKFAAFEDAHNLWRRAFEKKTQSRLEELQRAVKQMVSYMGKVGEDAKTRDTMLAEEYKALHGSVTAALEDLRDKTSADDAALEERVAKLAAGMFEKASAELEEREKNWKSLGSGESEQWRRELEKALEDSEQRSSRNLEKAQSELREEAKQKALMVEGGAQAFALQIEKRLKKSIEKTEAHVAVVKGEVRASEERVKGLLAQESAQRAGQLDELRGKMEARVEKESEQLWQALQEGDSAAKEEAEKSLEVAKSDMLEHVEKTRREAAAAREELATHSEVKQAGEVLEESMAVERKERKGQFSELIKMHDVQRRIVDETMDKHVQAMGAVAKALVAEQRAGREAASEEVLKVLNERIDKTDLANRAALEARAEQIQTEIKLVRDDVAATAAETKQHVAAQSQLLREDVEKGVQEGRKVARQMEREMADAASRSVVSGMVDRLALESEIWEMNGRNGQEIYKAEERIQERVEAVRQLLQNDIDHAMKEVRGDGDGQGQDGSGGGLKNKVRKVAQEVKEVANDVDEKINTLDFKVVEMEQKLLKLDEPTPSLEALRKEHIQPIQDRLSALEKQLDKAQAKAQEED